MSIKAKIKKEDINQLIKNDYFTKDQGSLHKAFNPVFKINQIYIHSKRDSEKQRKLKNKTFEEIQNPKPIEEIKGLFFNYKNKEKRAMSNYRKISQDNKKFCQTYRVWKSQKPVGNFEKNLEKIINQYSRNGYKISKNLGKQDAFKPSPLVMTERKDLDLHFKSVAQNNHDHNIKIANVKSVQYLKRMSDYIHFLQDKDRNIKDPLDSPFMKNYQKALILEYMESKKKKKEIEKNDNKENRRNIFLLNKTLSRLDKDPDYFNKDNIIEFKDKNKCKSTSVSSTNISFFSPKNNRNERCKRLTNTKSQIIIPQIKKSILRKRKSLLNDTSFRDISQLSINDLFHSTKSVSFVNNDNIESDIRTYLNHQSVNQSHSSLNQAGIQVKDFMDQLEKKKYNSHDMFELIVSAKLKIKAKNIPKRIQNRSQEDLSLQMQDKLANLTMLDNKINKLDFDFYSSMMSDQLKP